MSALRKLGTSRRVLRYQYVKVREAAGCRAILGEGREINLNRPQDAEAALQFAYDYTGRVCLVATARNAEIHNAECVRGRARLPVE